VWGVWVDRAKSTLGHRPARPIMARRPAWSSFGQVAVTKNGDRWRSQTGEMRLDRRIPRSMANGGEGRRRNRTQEVAGSSPASSTTERPAKAGLSSSVERTRRPARPPRCRRSATALAPHAPALLQCGLSPRLPVRGAAREQRSQANRYPCPPRAGGLSLDDLDRAAATSERSSGREAGDARSHDEDSRLGHFG
jgi:hypothetical protein